MSAETIEAGPSQLETLAGGTNVEIKTGSGVETVFVRQLKVRDYPKLVSLLDDEPAKLELYCDKPPGWSDSLEAGAFETLLLAGERLNKDFFGRWLERRKRAAELKPKHDEAELEQLFRVVTKVDPTLLPNLLKAQGLLLEHSLPTSRPKQE